MTSGTTILNPSFRDENSMRNYPFVDNASFLSNGLELSRHCVLDAIIRKPRIGRISMTRFNGSSKVIEFSNSDTGVLVGVVRYGDGDYTIYSEEAYSSIAEDGNWYYVSSSAKIPIGVVVLGTPVEDDMLFTAGDMDLLPTCCLAGEPAAVEAIVVGSTLLTGPVVFRGTNGMVVYAMEDKVTGEKVIKFQAVGGVASEIQECYSLPPAVTSICVEQRAGSSIGFDDVVVQGPYEEIKDGIETQNDEFSMATPFDDTSENRYAGYILETPTERARVLLNSWDGVSTYVKMDRAISVPSFVLVAPNIVYMGHKSAYSVVYSGKVQNYIKSEGSYQVTVDGKMEPHTLAGSWFLFYSVAGEKSVCTTVLDNTEYVVFLETEPSTPPALGDAYEVRNAMYTSISDICSRDLKMPLPDSNPVTTEYDQCDTDILPDPDSCGLFPAKSERCYFPLNGVFWILPGRNVEGDRPLLGISASSKTVAATVVTRSGVPSEIAETRGTLTVSLRGTRINA